MPISNAQMKMKAGRFAEIVVLMAGTAIIAAIISAKISAAVAADWVEVGADTQAKYYVDVDSIKAEGENVSVLKRGIFTQVLTDRLGGTLATFRQTIGTVEIDCARRINRVTQIDMIGENGEVVWSSGMLKNGMWEDARPNTHAETTIAVVCTLLKKSSSTGLPE